MERGPVAALLSRLDSPDRERAWSEFLDLYSPLILQVAHLFETDEDRASESFLFACEQLSKNEFRRLKSFQPDGPAVFSTWLWVVVRNLCLDWRRKQHGRPWTFKSVARLGALDQEVFDCIYQRGMSLEQTHFSLRASWPGLTEERVSESLCRVDENLTSRQRWLLSTRHPKIRGLEKESPTDEGTTERQIADSGPTPEILAAIREQRSAMARALSRLAKKERLLLRLRYEQGLTLEQVARIAGLGNAQRAERQIKRILTLLRDQMCGPEKTENRERHP